MKSSITENTADVLMIIKPDGMVYIGKILQRLSEHKLTLKALKHLTIQPEQAELVYQEHKGKYYFNTLIQYLTMAPSIVIAVRGDKDAIAEAKREIRVIAKEEAEKTRSNSLPYFLGDLSTTEKVKANLAELTEKFQAEYIRTFDGIHCSDIEAGSRELQVFFDDQALASPRFNEKRASEIVRDKLANRPSPLAKNPLDEMSHQFLNFSTK